MFAYNPTVNDRSGEILAQGIMQQNANRASQQQQIAETIGSAIASLGIIIKKKQEDAAKAATIGEALSTMQSVLPTYGKEGAALANIITQRVEASGNNLDKMSGILMSAKPAMDDLSARYNQKAQIDGYKELYTQKAQAAADAKAAQPPKYDFNYATEFNKALYDNGITDPEQQKQKFNEAGIGHLYDKFINPPKQNMGFFGPITQ